MTRFVTYDVFTDTPYGGNPLAVIPDATALPEEALQRIAREFNYSETTFVFPAEDPAHTAKVRIFTPTQEVPFAGHPLIGTAIALRHLGQPGTMVLELGIGPIPCTVGRDGARFTTTAPLQTQGAPDPALIARCLSLTPGEIAGAPVIASLGLPFAFAEVADRDALARCRPVTDAFREGAEAHPSELDFAVFAWCRRGEAIHARMFAPLDDIPEDPATGSACATLGALLREQVGTDQALTIHQGEDMGRPSKIVVTADADGVHVSGQAVKMMEGTLAG